MIQQNYYSTLSLKEKNHEMYLCSVIVDAVFIYNNFDNSSDI